MLLIIEGHGDDQHVKQCAGALDDIEVAVRNRIKAPWINGDAGAGVGLSCYSHSIVLGGLVEMS